MLYRLLYKGWHVLLLGSNANNSVTAGVFYVNSNNSSSNANSNIGSHLCLLKTIYNNLASWQNTKQSLITVWYPDSIGKRTGGDISR